MEKVLVSRCLLGDKCRWDGKQLDSAFRDNFQQYKIFSICPEMDGGLACPRPKAELTGNGFDALDGKAIVVDSAGHDLTVAFIKGAQTALNLALANNISRTILKDKSPSCGVKQIYVNGKLADGAGVTAALLSSHKLEITAI